MYYTRFANFFVFAVNCTYVELLLSWKGYNDDYR